MSGDSGRGFDLESGLVFPDDPRGDRGSPVRLSQGANNEYQAEYADHLMSTPIQVYSTPKFLSHPPTAPEPSPLGHLALRHLSAIPSSSDGNQTEPQTFFSAGRRKVDAKAICEAASELDPVGRCHPQFECPSIQITSISPCRQELEQIEDEECNPELGREHYQCQDRLILPIDHMFCREPSLSPASSPSSRSCFSEASSLESYTLTVDDVDAELNHETAHIALHHHSPVPSPSGSPLLPSPSHSLAPSTSSILQEGWQDCSGFLQVSPFSSPGTSPYSGRSDDSLHSPLSQPCSPGGKRKHVSSDYFRPASAYSPLSTSPTAQMLTPPQDAGCHTELPGSPVVLDISANIPPKNRRTDVKHNSNVGEESIGMQEDAGFVSEPYLSAPPPYPWSKGKQSTSNHSPFFRSTSVPPLDWQLPSQAGVYELRLDVQPKSHHRAHYETEGSRGAVKAAGGGHPVIKLKGGSQQGLKVQLFIGTADERPLRPHPFYQVHRITGKAVGTSSQEMELDGIKMLEIPLHPEDNMTACIDCAGILKLRNSDIELRKGETDVGRKNTRVRLVFRVNIPQPGGRVLCLQTMSVPIECSQRSAQELPMVEQQSIVAAPVHGGGDLVLTGHNFLLESRVLFIEKGPDGRSMWEMEAKVDRRKCEPTCLVVNVPPYCNQNLSVPTHIHFLVSNGKRRRSQLYPFTYLPTSDGPSCCVKDEPGDDDVLAFGPLLQHLLPLPGPREAARAAFVCSGDVPSSRSALCSSFSSYSSEPPTDKPRPSPASLIYTSCDPSVATSAAYDQLSLGLEPALSLQTYTRLQSPLSTHINSHFLHSALLGYGTTSHEGTEALHQEGFHLNPQPLYDPFLTHQGLGVKLEPDGDNYSTVCSQYSLMEEALELSLKK
uniref:nuclear factor of activated T-cells, cytoplasmic 1-like n=1 Tax=Myxine glutinosa TaxID=7769 RepID=UPI00358E1CBA